MVQAVSGEVARKTRTAGKALNTGNLKWHTAFIDKRVKEVEDLPQAFLIDMSENSTIPPHFHQVDQFQVFVAGSGNLGRNTTRLIALHYVDHHTAYGPINSGPAGLSIFTIRAKSDPYGIYLNEPNHKEMLRPTKKRYLFVENIALSTAPVLAHRSEAALENLLSEADGRDGLGAYMLRLGANMKTTGPDPKVTAGQYYLVLNGSLEREQVSYPAWSIVYAAPTDMPLDVYAGTSGLEVLILNFPQAEA